MVLDICCICLDATETLLKLNFEDKNNIKVLKKLKGIAPEQEWQEIFSICSKCHVQLENAYNFTILCIKNDWHRRNYNQQRKEQIHYENDLDHKDQFIKGEDSPENTIIDGQENVGDLCEKPKKPKSTSTADFETCTCIHCKRRFKSKSNLQTHLNARHCNICVQCTKNFITKKELQVHKRNFHQNIKSSKFQCELCEEPYSLLKDILEHCVKVHSMNPKEVKPYWCTLCKNKFNSSALLIQHKKYHDGDRTYICSSCGKSFITKRDLSGHEKLHENQRQYACGKCNKSFKTSQNLKTHIYVVHTDPSKWKYGCHVCSKRFAMKSNFNEHVKRHQGTKAYNCHICKKSFVSNHEVKKHIYFHSNIAPYKCSQCQKSYRFKSNLDLHLSKAHGIGNCKIPERIKKFICHVCPSQFFDNHKLQKHIRTHTGIKPFACHGCDKRFVDKSYLSRHLKSVHNISKSINTEDAGNNS